MRANTKCIEPNARQKTIISFLKWPLLHSSHGSGWLAINADFGARWTATSTLLWGGNWEVKVARD